MIMVGGQRMVPCGECVALVPAATGCQHYRPQIAATARRGDYYQARSQQQRDRMNERLAQARRERDRVVTG